MIFRSITDESEVEPLVSLSAKRDSSTGVVAQRLKRHWPGSARSGMSSPA